VTREVNLECDDMSRDDPSAQADRREALSALMDGQSTEADMACRAWRDDAGARADWHAYHLIGELMRSDDVRCAAQHDARFLAGLRERLAAEPVMLAPPAPVVPARQSPWRRAWVAPMAVAAGFVAVAGVLVVTRVAAPEGAVPDRSALLTDARAARHRAAKRGGGRRAAGCGAGGIAGH
jgi:sigma-E factor negative regulatory protein RseA